MNTNKSPLLFIQDTCRKNNIIDDEVIAANNIRLQWYTFGYVYFSECISIDEDFINELKDNIKLIVRSGTKIIRMVEDETTGIHPALRQKMKEGIWHSKYFDQENLKGTPIEKHLLNANAEYMKYSDCKHMMFPQDVFIKPSGDLKEFSGGILPKETTIKDFVMNNFHDNNIEDANVLISTNLQYIHAEARFIVVDGKIISGSYYKIKNKLESVKIHESSPIFQYTQKLADIFEPEKVYTIDVAILPGMEIKIVEYNCFNCSGLYAIDTEKVFKAIANFVSK